MANSGAGGDYQHNFKIRSGPERNNWTLDSEQQDSGNFTVSPDVDHPISNSGSESSRSHSPSSNGSNHNYSRDNTSTSASLVLQASREGNVSVPGLDSLANTDAYLRHRNTMNESNQSFLSTKNKYASNEECSDISSPSTPSVGYLKIALGNFNALYQEKLKEVEDLGAQGDAAMKERMMEKKANILECWAKDVCVQNIVLIDTVEELERQGEAKLKMLQQKVNESSSLANKHKSIVESYEQRIQSLMRDSSTSCETEKVLKSNLEKMKTEYKRIRGRINQLEKDNDSLVTLVTRIRDMGVWDVDGLEFHKRTYAQMFDLYPNLPGSEVQTVFTKEKAKRIIDTQDSVQRLEEKVKELETFNSEAAYMINSKDSKIVDLESEIRLVSNKLQHCQREVDHYKNALIETQEKLLQASNELQLRSKAPSRPETADSDRHAETRELLQELRNVKTQLNMSIQESQIAKEETSLIRREFNERLCSMQESQQCLQSELSHSFESHQTKEYNAEINKLKDQSELYQSKCEKSEKQLNDKDKVIDELRQTINHLNHKISDIKEEWNRVFSNIDPPQQDLNGEFSLEPQKGKIDKSSHNCAKNSGVGVDEERKPVALNVERQQLMEQFELEKTELKEELAKILKDKDIEITMQKVTIQHLQNALVSMKKGQPFPVPTSSANANGINCGKVVQI